MMRSEREVSWLRRARRSVVAASIGVVAAAASSTGACSLDTDARPCITADDCSTPYLCCTSGTALVAEGGGPRCIIPQPTLSFCESFLPHLVEGNPCGRSPVDPAAEYPPAAVDQCRDSLVCCATTLVCEPAGDCSGDPPPVVEGASSGESCSSDDTCPGDEICCGISYFDREGACRHIAECADEVAAQSPPV